MLGNGFGRQFDVGIHFNAQVNGGFTGPTLTNDIRSDSTSATAIAINGTHATAAIAIGASSGKVIIGGTTGLSAPSRLEVLNATGADPIAYFGTSAGICNIGIQTAGGYASIGVMNGPDQGVVGSVAGDMVLRSGTSGKAVLMGGTTSVLEVTNANTIGFFNATPVSQRTGWGDPTGTATRTTFATGSVTLPVLAEHVMAIILDLKAYGHFGA